MEDLCVVFFQLSLPPPFFSHLSSLLRFVRPCCPCVCLPHFATLYENKPGLCLNFLCFFFLFWSAISVQCTTLPGHTAGHHVVLWHGWVPSCLVTRLHAVLGQPPPFCDLFPRPTCLLVLGSLTLVGKS